MLFTDGTILTIQDLCEHDNFVLEVASTEQIELGPKIAVAQREIGYELSAFLIARAISGGLQRVVVTPELRDLLAPHTRATVYRDAYNTHLNDRYLGRSKEYARATERGLMRLLHNGIGLAACPAPRPPAPVVTTSDEGGLTMGLFYIQTAWKNLAGTISERSPFTIVTVTAGSVSVSPGIAPADAAGWYVYMGEQDSHVFRQNEALLELGSLWTQSAALRTDLNGPGPSGPDYYVRNSDQLLRG